MNPGGKYRLNEDGEPVPEPDLFAWGEWFQTANCRVFRTELPEGVWVSTIFLGLDHDYTGKGPPILWETMVFKNGKSEEGRRCAGSREQAEAMHEEMVARFAPPVPTE